MIELEDLLNDRTFLTKEFLFEHVTEEEIFCKFFPLEKINFHKLYRNPLRTDDDEGGCSFYYNKTSGKLYFHDWAWKHFDCFAFVQSLYSGLNYHRTLQLIATEFNLISRSHDYVKPVKLEIKPQIDKTLQIQRKKFTKLDLEFWKKYDNSITYEDLEKSNIISLKTAWLNGKIIYNWSNNDVVFAYHLQEGYHYQLYNPKGFYNNPRLKFFSSGNQYILGWETIDWNCEYIIIGKSYKCWWIQKRYGLNIIARLTETGMLTDEIMYELKDFLVFTLFDNDRKGKQASIEYRNKYGTIPLLFPKEEEKDFSDNCAKFGRNYMLDYIENIKQNFNL